MGPNLISFNRARTLHTDFFRQAPGKPGKLTTAIMKQEYMRQILKILSRELHSHREGGKGGENQAKTPTTSIPIPVPPTRYPIIWPSQTALQTRPAVFYLSVFALPVFSVCNVISSLQAHPSVYRPLLSPRSVRNSCFILLNSKSALYFLWYLSHNF